MKVIFILESPPVSGNYFYDEEGKVTEPLFAAMMKHVMGIEKCEHKSPYLKQFARKGYLVVDATYEPINNKKGKERNDVILRNYKELEQDLAQLIQDHVVCNVKLILIKANVWKILRDKLDKFDVCNKGDKIPFPSHGWQKTFGERIKTFL